MTIDAKVYREQDVNYVTCKSLDSMMCSAEESMRKERPIWMRGTIVSLFM